MKPTSIIFLIFAVVLLLTGIIVCGVAKGIADKEGVVLFEQSVEADGSTLIKKEMPQATVTKLEIDLKDTAVNIYRGAESSYLELVNYNVNSYGLSVSNNTLTVSDSFNIASLFKSSEGMQFKGLRYTILGDKNGKGDKTVNVYLADDSDVRNVSVGIDSGAVTVKGIEKDIDYLIETGSGNVTFEEVKNASSVQIKCGGGLVSFNYSQASVVDVDIASGDLNVINKTSDQISYTVNVTGGVVRYNGEDKGSSFEAVSGDPRTKFTARIGDGQVIINDIER